MIMKNLHLVPVVVQDIGEKVNAITVNSNEKLLYIGRLEAIREYCDSVLTKSTGKVQFFDPSMNRKRYNRK
jgi:hypothetical protein